MAEHITEVYFLNVPLENDYKNTLYFTSKSTQESYFKNNVKKSYVSGNTMSYQRKDGFIRVEEDMDTLLSLGINYVMYQNKAFSNKWFYAFITDMKYISAGRTDVYIETDVMQTWFFEMNVKASFVEREHVSDDTVGLHTVPEGLETGEYVSNQVTYSNLGNIVYVVAYTETSDGTRVTGNMFNNLYSGLHYSAFSNDSEGIKAMNNFLAEYDTEAKANAIVCIFTAPRVLIMSDTTSTIKGASLSNTDDPLAWNMAIDPVTTLNGYTPKNNKLFTFPYCYMHVDNGAGGSAIYHYELFDIQKDVDTVDGHHDECRLFDIFGALTPGMSIRMYPEFYKRTLGSESFALTGPKYPICAWTSDVYTNWLTQNGVNIGLDLLKSGATTLAGIGASFINPLVGAGAVASGIYGIANSVATVYEHHLVPAESRGNVNSGDVTVATKGIGFQATDMSIRKEYAQIIDDYFSMFGYKVNRVKVPNKAHRSRWWYTKTIDVNIDGAIPNTDMQKIKDCYNKGITFWRNAAEIQNYSLSNGIAITDGAVI